jgi:hypothetical protein
MWIGGWILATLKLNPRYELKNYPYEIKKDVAPQSREEKKRFIMIAIPSLCAAAGYIIFSITYIYRPAVFWPMFMHVFLALTIWNAFDLIVFDWLIFCTVTPGFMILPGTKGHPAYKDYMFHFAGFLKGVVMAMAAATVLAGVLALKR